MNNYLIIAVKANPIRRMPARVELATRSSVILNKKQARAGNSLIYDLEQKKARIGNSFISDLKQQN